MSPADAALIDEFADALWLANGLSQNTLSSYRFDLKGFAGWLNQTGSALLSVDGATVNAYLAHRHQSEKKPSANSQRRLHSTLRRFYQWLLAENRIHLDPMLNIERPMKTARFPKTLSEAQVGALLGVLSRTGLKSTRPLLRELRRYADAAGLDAFVERLVRLWLEEGAPEDQGRVVAETAIRLHG